VTLRIVASPLAGDVVGGKPRRYGISSSAGDVVGGKPRRYGISSSLAGDVARRSVAPCGRRRLRV